MNTLYLDLFSGISGDMFLGALIDLGIEPRALERELQKLALAGWHLHTEHLQKAGIAGVKAVVQLDEPTGPSPPPAPPAHAHPPHAHAAHPHAHPPQASEHGHAHPHHHEHHEAAHGHEQARDFAEIKTLIERSALSDWVKAKAVAVFRRIAEAEGKIHGRPPDQVHFHEVGAVDSIIDIVGACLGLELLDRPRVLASPVVEGTGWIHCAHGRFPVPAPATLEILGARGVPLTQCDEPHELVTPTGAALLAEFAESFGPLKDFVAARIGYGLGTRELQTRPNVLRALLGWTMPTSGRPADGAAGSEAIAGAAATAGAHDWETDTIAVLETNLDDIPAELLGHFVEKALAAGALDVFHTPVHMKKNRPGVLLTVLCATADADRFTEFMLRQTTAFGVRRYLAERRKLRREMTAVPTAFGEVAVKLGKLDGRVLHATPEFESCRRTAEQAQVTVKEVYAAALQAAYRRADA